MAALTLWNGCLVARLMGVYTYLLAARLSGAWLLGDAGRLSGVARLQRAGRVPGGGPNLQGGHICLNSVPPGRAAGVDTFLTALHFFTYSVIHCQLFAWSCNQ